MFYYAFNRSFLFFQVIINGEQKIDAVNKNPRVFNNVKYYVSSPWYEAAKAEIRKVKTLDFPHKGKSTDLKVIKTIDGL